MKKGRPTGKHIETTPKSGCHFCEGSGFHFSRTQPCQACDGTGKEIVRRQKQKVHNAKNGLPLNYNIKID